MSERNICRGTGRLLAQKNKGVWHCQQKQGFPLRRAKVEGHVELEGPGRLASGEGELAVRSSTCSSSLSPLCRDCVQFDCSQRT